MRQLLPVLLVALLAGGCGEKAAPLPVEKKAKLISEMLSNEPPCVAFKQRLAAPALERSELDAIYREAKKAACVRRDV